MLTSPLTPELVWGLVPRILGAVFVVAFVSLSRQVLPLVGRRGISPLHQRLARLARDVPAPRRWFEQPTLFWLLSSDGALTALPWIGAAGGLLAVVGGPVGWYGLLLCWLCYLSLDVCGLWLPWDTFLLEAGFLALFLPTTHTLPEVAAAALPLPSVAFLFRWLLVRLMWGFGKLKFLGTERGDSLYLQGFLTWMPMPTPLGWLFQHAPDAALRLGCAFMWVAEVVAPLLALFGGTPRLVGAGLLVTLMLGIGSTGNWGHFNLAYAGMCVLLLDAHASLGDLFAPGAPSLLATPDVFVHSAMATLFCLSLLLFPLNSWVTQSFVQWNADRFTWRRPWLDRLLAGLRLFNRLRLVGAYGVFPPNTSPPIKMVPVLEGSHDGRTWTPIPWRFMPVGERSPPRFIAPHHPRLDHSCIYVGLGLNEADPVGGLMFEAKPHGMSPYSHHSWLHRLVQRVLEGEPSVLRLLGQNPFADAPPTWVRVVHRCLKPTSLAERRRSGRWWHARSMTVLHEPVRSDPSLWDHWLPEPEAVHPELTHWRRRSPTLAAMRAAARQADGDASSLRQALCAASELTPGDVAEFWERFVPFVADASQRDGWDTLPATAAAMRERFGVPRLRVLERIHQRAVHLLEARVEPHVYGDAQPRWHVEHPFHLQAALGAAVFNGERAFAALWREPGGMAARAASLDEAALLYPTALLRWDLVRFVGRTLRSRSTLSRAPDMPFGIGRHKAFLLSRDFGPQWFPECRKRADGHWAVPAEAFEAGDQLGRRDTLPAMPNPNAVRLEPGDTIPIERRSDELTVLDELLDLDGRDILELGCGRGEKTLALAAAGTDRRVVALEVDEIQHALNRELDGPDNVRFGLGGAEAIPVEDGSFDVVLLFKSLHHVPVDGMDRALEEIARVLRPGGFAAISEPLFRGDFNELLRLFHDESRVRRAALQATERAVRSGTLALVSQTFFLAPLHFGDFDAFDRQVIGATHSRHALSDELRGRVRNQFARFDGEQGAHFEQPIRLDLLRKPPETTAGLRDSDVRSSERPPG